MDKFIVSARKYRPQNFSAVVGQSHITTTLKNAIRNHQLAHAFLFCGPRGVGKTTCARILAKTINCANPTAAGEACNHCPSCLSFNEGNSLNIHELDAASNNSVDDIRTLVEQVRFTPQAGKYKVYIIDEVHMLSSSAFNAFLKTLEEPPPYAIFILATTEKHKILPTILSRCQIFDFKRITIADTVQHMQEICEKEEIQADKASLQLIAQKSEGCMRDALSILDKIVSFTSGRVNYQNTLEHLNILDEDYYFQFMEAMTHQHLSEALLLFDDINQKGFEGDMVLNGLAEFVRNLLVSKDEKACRLLEVVEGFRDKYLTTAAQVDAGLLISALNVLSEAELNYKSARNKRLLVELTLIKLCYLQQALDLSGTAEGEVKKKSPDSAAAVSFRNIRPFATEKPKQPTSASSARSGLQEAKLLVQLPLPPSLAQAAAPPSSVPASRPAQVDPSPSTPTFGVLSKIRQQVANRQSQEAPAAQKDLDQVSLQQAWNAFTERLRQNKHSATQSFQRAVLKITDPQNFEVIANNNLEQKFIEQEKRRVTDFLQLLFDNKNISFWISLSPQAGIEDPQERMLTKREQYQQIAEQYPLVKELKERLKLELDY
jgi:DNA polymerase III subunit gamma/tau